MKTLQPFSSDWNPANLRTLLNRTMMGYSKSMWNEGSKLSREEVVNTLLKKRSVPEPPVNIDFSDDPYVKIGETWVNKPYPRKNKEAVRFRRNSLISWVIHEMTRKDALIYPKMILFWHNHFPIAKVNDLRFDYDYYILLHKHALGNFKHLTYEMTIHPAMLRYLNGNKNTSRNPNENFARELLELFTIGKGELAGEGDYSNYTEQDVQAIAKCLTGWRDYGYFSEERSDIGSFFRTNRHDKSTKTLSARFDHEKIPNLEEQEYRRVIDIIFSKKETANFISRKLFRWFVGSDIDEETEANVIQPMGELIFDSGYEIRPALQALLNSQVLYDEAFCGSIIKSPLEFLLPLYYHISFELDDQSEKYFQSFRSVYYTTNSLGQAFFNIPQVAGWKAYYQSPAWYQHWITTTSLSNRNEYAQRLLKINTRFDESRFGANMLQLLEEFEKPEDPTELVRELTLFMLPKPLSDEQIIQLKELFIPGLPDYEWTVEYNQYLNNPSDGKLKRSLNDKLKFLAYNIISLPDYQVI